MRLGSGRTKHLMSLQWNGFGRMKQHMINIFDKSLASLWPLFCDIKGFDLWTTVSLKRMKLEVKHTQEDRGMILIGFF